MKIGLVGIVMVALLMATIAALGLLFYSFNSGGGIGDVYSKDEIFVGYNGLASPQDIRGVEQKYGLERIWLERRPKDIQLGYYWVVSDKTAISIKKELIKEKPVVFADLIMVKNKKQILPPH